jgi:hypothetical protein
MDLSKEAFQAWKRLPETKAVLQYLLDRRSDLMNDWAEGRIGHTDLDASLAEAMLYKTIAELPYDDIEFFYSK